jgi:Zn finger protein HypA/HybF involved in hydrogenase expression
MTDTDAVKLLRSCKPIVAQLTAQGITTPLSETDKNILLEYNKVLAIYSKELRFLADRAGLALHELGTLRVRANIELERSRGSVECPRCGCDKYEGEHHYLCEETGLAAITDQEMRVIIEYVRRHEASVTAVLPLAS